MTEPDLLKRLSGPALVPLRALVAAIPAPEPIHEALGQVVDLSGLVVIAGLLAALGAFTKRHDAWLRATAAGSGILALPLGLWLLRHPSDRFDDLFLRWDQLAFAGTAGFALTVLAAERRKWWLAALSLALLLCHAGPLAVCMAVGLTVAGIALLRTRLLAGTGPTVAAHAALLLAVYGFALALRTWNFPAAARLQGLLAFWVLRHISLVVSAVRSGLPALADCGAYMTFYPGVMGLLGAPEVYDEFARRNLTRAPVLRHEQAARRLVEGVALLVAATLVPVSLERLAASTSAAEAWTMSIALFVKTACKAMGLWRSVEVTALLYGMHLHPNFAGLLTARNPSQLWHAWRGTFTNWLIRHVYVPMGGNRRHQSLNILAAFGVSFLWHAMGVVFLTPTFRLEYVAGVAFWAGANACAVLAYLHLRRAGLHAPERIPAPVRVATATAVIWMLGSLTPIMLHYQGPAVERLPHLLGLLIPGYYIIISARLAPG